MRSWMSHTIKEREKDASVVRLEEEARAREDHSNRFALLLIKMDDERGQYTKTEQYSCSYSYCYVYSSTSSATSR